MLKISSHTRWENAASAMLERSHVPLPLQHVRQQQIESDFLKRREHEAFSCPPIWLTDWSKGFFFWGTAEHKTTEKNEFWLIGRIKGWGGDKGVPYNQVKRIALTFLVPEVARVYRFQISSKVSHYHPPPLAYCSLSSPLNSSAQSTIAFNIIKNKKFIKKKLHQCLSLIIKLGKVQLRFFCP